MCLRRRCRWAASTLASSEARRRTGMDWHGFRTEVPVPGGQVGHGAPLVLPLSRWSRPRRLLINSRPEFGPPLGRVMTSQNNVWKGSRAARIRELGRHRLHLRPVVARRWRWEWSRALDLCRVIFQPLAVVEGDRRDNATAVAVGGGKTPFLDGTLGENDLIAERTDPH